MLNYQPEIIDNSVNENTVYGTSRLGSDDTNDMFENVDFHQMDPKSQNQYFLEKSDVFYTSSNSCSRDIGIFDNINKNEADIENEIRFDNGFWSGAQKNISYPRWNPHLLTGIQNLHDRGLTGKNVIVGVIDSGAYYHDQGLRGSYGPNYKIKQGWNFAGRVYNQDFQTGFFGSNSDILDCYGHGTHVTGIIGGSNNSQFVGVAPGATIYSYKVFGCVGITSNDNIAQAMVMTYDDGCDVISMSLGVDGASFEDDPTAIIADRLVEHGVFVASSAANAGAVGPYYGNSVASGRKVASVGSCSTGQYIAYKGKLFSTSGDWTSFAYVPTSGVQPNLTGKFMLKIYNNTGCSLAGTIPSNSNGENIALLFAESINCKPDQFYLSIAQLGYPVILQYSLQNQFSFNNGYSKPERGLYDPVAVRGTVPPGFGKWVMSQMNRGHNVSITFDAESLIPKSVITQNSIKELRMGLYSSWGPDYSGNLYPHITAPGTNIYSTYLNNTYSISSGTSMAAPYRCLVLFEIIKLFNFLTIHIDCRRSCLVL